jgi:hypothetical protein
MRAASQEGSLLVGKVWPRGDRVGWWGMSVLALFKGFSGSISMKLISALRITNSTHYKTLFPVAIKKVQKSNHQDSF